MAGIAHLLLSEAQPAAINRCLTHPADTVRGWGCFMLGARSGLTLSERLAAASALQPAPVLAGGQAKDLFIKGGKVVAVREAA